MGRSRPASASRHVAKYLAPNETVMLEMTQHWARILPALASVLTGLALVLLTGFTAPASLEIFADAAWWIWLVLVLHFLWRVIEWRDELFVITNRRLVLVHGIFVKKVAMMPLSKVTDMSYNRSLGARLLGYGTFVMESAGQEQALSTIDHVRDPDAIYRDLCGLIFGDDEDAEDEPRAADWRHPSSDPRPRDTDMPYDVDRDDQQGRPSRRLSRRGAAPEGPGDFDAAFVDRYQRHDPYAQEYRQAHADDPDDASVDRTVVMPTRRTSHHTPQTGRSHASSASRTDDTDPYGLVTEPLPGRQERPGDPYDVSNGTGPDEMDDQSAWSVSREHATRPQPARRSRHTDPPVTWRDRT